MSEMPSMDELKKSWRAEADARESVAKIMDHYSSGRITIMEFIEALTEAAIVNDLVPGAEVCGEHFGSGWPCPTCDICDHSECLTPDKEWNGETGNHVECESQRSDMQTRLSSGRSPHQINATLARALQGIADIDPMDPISEIVDDVLNSVGLTLISANVPPSFANEVIKTARDYYTNNYA